MNLREFRLFADQNIHSHVVLSANIDVTPLFIVVAQRSMKGVTIRVRQLQ